MGCDIHLYVEKKDHQGRWINIDNWRINPDWSPEAEKDEDDPQRYLEHRPYYRDRDYALFAILADVRNYDDGVQSIAGPRGIPTDLSSPTISEVESWDSDGHSHSYLTMKELVERHNSGEPKKYSGMVSAQTAKDLDEGIALPKAWCGSTTDESWAFREWTEDGSHLDRLMASLLPVYKKEFWIWEPMNAEQKKRFDENLEKFRIVFWFDN